MKDFDVYLYDFTSHTWGLKPATTQRWKGNNAAFYRLGSMLAGKTAFKIVDLCTGMGIVTLYGKYQEVKAVAETIDALTFDPEVWFNLAQGVRTETPLLGGGTLVKWQMKPSPDNRNKNTFLDIQKIVKDAGVSHTF